MQLGRFLCVLGVSSFWTACAIHPLPEDVTRNSTVDIVQKIRCEARGAIILHASIDGPDFAEAKLQTLLRSPGDKEERIKALLKPAFRSAAIGYDFKFTINESDGSSASTTFTFPFSNGRFLLGLGGGEQKERKSDRSFDIVENFWEVLGQPIEDCQPSSKNWKYPITGEIGLDEVLKTYVRITELANLKGSLAKRQSDQDITFTDELTFTTSFNGRVDTSIDVNPVIHDLRLTRASASFGADRKDVHKVTVALVTDFRLPSAPRSLRSFAPLAGAGDNATKTQAKQNLFRRRTEGLLENLENLDEQ
jgi:hypothetical protein